MAAVKAVLLDLGNVLVFHDNALLFARLGARAGLSGPEVGQRLTGAGWTAANRGLMDAEGIRQDVCRALGVDLPMAEFAHLWSSHFTLHTAVLPRVEGLVGRVKLGLVSNTNALHAAYLRPLLPVLQRFHGDAFVGKTADAFEIVGYDRDGIPEHVGVWEWGDLSLEECCPFCGCLGGLHFQEASWMYHCLACDTLTNFEDDTRTAPEP